MRTFFTGLILLTLLTTACDKSENQISPSEAGFVMKMNNQTVINFSDINYYDFSTHMIYLTHDFFYFKDEELHNMDEFTVYADGEKIYTGHTFPGYCSYMPKGPVIHCDPNFYSDYVVPIGFINIIDTLGIYTARFNFPGLHWVDKQALKQDEGRIWLGKISFQKEILVQ